MENFQRIEIKKRSPHHDEFELILYFHDYLTEFANELGTISIEKMDFTTLARQILRERFPSLKVTVVKVILGGIAVASIPLTSPPTSAHAADLIGSDTLVTQTDSIYYHVASGETLWKISVKFGTSVDLIKKANHLTSDVVQLNQRLIIPKAIHTVATGDYLTVLAKKYGTTVEGIKLANNLTSDSTNLGQTLIIPIIIGSQTSSEPAPASVPPLAPAQAPTNVQYSVVSGDTLWGISTKFKVSLDALRSANQLQSDLVKIGQTLVIPNNGAAVTAPAVTPAPNVTNTSGTNYTVVSGDSLSAIAKRYNISVDQLKRENQLTSDIIRVGQVLTIPNAPAGPSVESVPVAAQDVNLATVQKNLQILGYYAVPTMTGSYDATVTQSIKSFQADYGLPVTGTVNEATTTAIDHAVVKKALVNDTTKYLGVQYVWGGTTPSGFDCSGFVYYMFNQHDVNMARNTSAGLFKTGTAIDRAHLQPGDLVFFAVNTTGTISHVGFYMGDNQFISATNSKGIAVYSMDSTYWGKYYVGAKRIY